MASEVPSDFDKPWSLSDVVLQTNNSDGKDIHAYKGALAMFSPYFRVLFFGDFREKNDTTVNVDCDYDVMVEILRNIHQIGFKYAVGQKKYDPDMMVKMYRAADRYDFAFIRKLCIEHMEEFASVQMANVATTLRLYDVLMRILAKLDSNQAREFLHQNNAKYYLNKEEFLVLFEKVVGKPLPKSTETSDIRPSDPLNLEEITGDLENPRVDLTKPWRTADLMIMTENSMGRVLYANRAVLEMMCPKFDRYMCKTNELHLEGPEWFLARIGEEYTTMKEILSVIHICKTDRKPDRILHPALLHSMYCAARKDRLDIPAIRNTCITKLMEHKSIDAMEVLWRLNLNTCMCKVHDSLSIPQHRDWIFREDGHLFYRKGTGVVSASIGRQERKLYRNITCWFLDNFKKEFFSGK